MPTAGHPTLETVSDDGIPPPSLGFVTVDDHGPVNSLVSSPRLMAPTRADCAFDGGLRNSRAPEVLYGLAIRLASVPMRSTSTSTRSSTCRKCSENWPAPRGLPVAMTSPTSRVWN
ncbi:hypothetical protein M2284_003341 [Rhodococcus sp. LBL1]|nr:hypothetical protein [Rhodococcus sp. LBL1]MDH6685135.1 hypothetical protein [Rhodococcus sp. LBL2]